MRYTFKFLLANGKTELLSFQATTFKDAQENAFRYSRVAFNNLELIEFYYLP